jgi:hypothetical protein
MFGRLFGKGEAVQEGEGEGPIVIRVEFHGRTFVQRYSDLEMAQIRFPQYLADLTALYGRETRDRPT